jgi:hypothetical protein
VEVRTASAAVEAAVVALAAQPTAQHQPKTEEAARLARLGRITVQTSVVNGEVHLQLARRPAAALARGACAVGEVLPPALPPWVATPEEARRVDVCMLPLPDFTVLYR